MDSRVRTKELARLRFALGMAQMFGAVAAATLLIWKGITAATLLAAIASTALSLTSRMLFRGDR